VSIPYRNVWHNQRRTFLIFAPFHLHRRYKDTTTPSSQARDLWRKYPGSAPGRGIVLLETNTLVIFLIGYCTRFFLSIDISDRSGCIGSRRVGSVRKETPHMNLSFSKSQIRVLIILAFVTIVLLALLALAGITHTNVWHSITSFHVTPDGSFPHF
jgi:hypothetical protein